MARRRAAVEAALAQAGCDHLVFCGANRAGSVVQWLTQWPVTAEAVGVLTPGLPDALFLQYVNHPPLAKKLADQAEVAWGGKSSIAAAIAVLEKRGARADRVGVIGPLNFEQHAALAARFGKVASLNRAYVRLRRVKSEEEIDWLRLGAWLSDLGMAGLRDGLEPGLDERELGDLIERAYVRHGGTNVIHYIGVTSMRDPQLGVPAQFPSTRRVQAGDIVFAEISAAFWDHPGQVLRSFALGADPPPLYRELHAAADAAFDAVAARAQARRHARAGGRSVGRDRGRGLHHHRRPAARLWRRLFSADPRQPQPAGGADPAGAVRGRHDGGDPAQRRHPRRQGRRADRRIGADHRDRHRVAAFIPARICAGLSGLRVTRRDCRPSRRKRSRATSIARSVLASLRAWVPARPAACRRRARNRAAGRCD